MASMDWYKFFLCVIKQEPVSVVKKPIEDANCMQYIPRGVVMLAALTNGLHIGNSQKDGEPVIRRRRGGLLQPC